MISRETLVRHVSREQMLMTDDGIYTWCLGVEITTEWCVTKSALLDIIYIT